MLEKEFHIARLIKNRLTSEPGEPDNKELQQWLSERAHNAEFFATLTEPKNFRQKLSEFESVESDAIWKLTQAKVEESHQSIAAARKLSIGYSRLRFIAAAAIAALVVSAGLWFFKERGDKNLAPVEYASDIAPGHQGATLTLANGEKIRLTSAKDGLVASETGVAITKTAAGELVYTIKANSADNRINTLSTENGETYQVRLPDGSKVWLNAASSLTYAANLLVDGKRNVKLTGEAYFQVARDKEHPFRVQTGDHQVEVLGTHFNINSYSNEPAIVTTLLEGSVKVSFGSGTLLLTPGEQAKLNTKGNFVVARVDTDAYVAWKERLFSFENEDIQTIMRMIERWYNVKVEYIGKISDEKFWGGVSRSDNVSKVLSALESTGKVHFEIKGNTISVFKNER